MPAIYHEGSWLGNATDPEVLVKDTVGWTGKNRAYSQTNNAVIAHIENGITYDVSWTGSAAVTLKKNSASGATITSGSTSPLSFTADADYDLYFGSSANVTDIMVWDSRIVDPTYEPYHESVEEEIEQIYADNGVLGAKNWLNNIRGTATINGITYIENDDGSVTINGTATASSGYFFTGQNNANEDFLPRNKKYILSTGTPIPTGMYVSINIGNSSSKDITDNNTSIAFTTTSNANRPRIYVNNGQTINNLTIYPMIRLASDPDDTYQPYAMTNRELTEKKVDKSVIELNNADLNDITETGFYYIRGGCTNVPDNIAYLSLKVQKNSDSNIHQMVLGASAIYTRIKTGSPATWSPWYKHTGTVVS